MKRQLPPVRKIIAAAILLGCFMCSCCVAVYSLYHFVMERDRCSFLIFIISLVLSKLLYHANMLEDKIFPMLRGRTLAFLFSGTHRNLTVGKGVKIMRGYNNISIGDDVTILHHALFAPLLRYNGQTFSPRISIGNHVSIGAYNRIAALNEVRIEDDVLFSAFVHITDHSHEYTQAGIPVMNQGVTSKGPVIIGKGAWLAYGCQIVGGG